MTQGTADVRSELEVLLKEKEKFHHSSETCFSCLFEGQFIYNPPVLCPHGFFFFGFTAVTRRLMV